MKTQILIGLLLLTFSTSILGQSVGIGTTSPDPSAILDLESTSQGLLVPRMTPAEYQAIANPAPGLIVFDTEDFSFKVWLGLTWGPIFNVPQITEIKDYDVDTRLVVDQGIDDDKIYMINRNHISMVLDSNGSVGVNVISPDPSSMMEIQGLKGVLIPRMATIVRDDIASPATGLLIYNTQTNTFNYYNGTSWISIDQVHTILSDTDGDTKIQVEESPDEDKIRFDVNGSQAMVIQPDGRVGIGTTGPDPSAILDLKSDSLGLLAPWIDSTTRANINNPAEGLLVYDTLSASFWYYAKGTWNELGGGGNIRMASATGKPILDLQYTRDTILISEESVIGGNLQLQVCIDVQHTWDSDLSMLLTTPAGDSIILTMGNGDDGDNYTNTCFGTGGSPIQLGHAPFSGFYAPETSLDSILGDSTQGMYVLTIYDAFPLDQGVLNNWSINLIRRAPIKSLTDADGDTWVTVEAGPDDDAIRIQNSAPNKGTLYLNNSDSAGFAGTYFYEGPELHGWVGHVNNSSTFGAPGTMQLGSAGQDIVFSSGPDNLFHERMRILADGNIGIGTASPGRRLVVSDTSTAANREVSELASAIGDPNFHLVAMKGAPENDPGTAMLKFGMVYGNNGSSLKSGLIRFHRGTSADDGSISFSTNNDVERMRIISDGKVFIGRTEGLTDFEHFGIRAPASGNSFGGMYVETYGGDSSRPFYGYAINNVVKAFQYYDGNTNTWTHYDSGPQLSVKSSGEVGIGTQNPKQKLHVAGDAIIDRGSEISALTRSITIGGYRSGANNDFGQLRFANYDSDSDPVDTTRAMISSRNANSTGGGDLRFFTSPDGTLQEQMIISHQGNVGIGISTPERTLHVQQSSNALNSTWDSVVVANLGALISRPEVTQGGVGIGFVSTQAPGNVGAAIVHERTGSQSRGQLHFATKSSTGIGDNIAVRMTIDETGNVGIGTTNPTKARLEIVGSQMATVSYAYLNNLAQVDLASGTNAYGIYANERIAASEFNAHSDARIKHIISKSNSKADLEKLLQIEITDYVFVDSISRGKSPQKKVIAQQIEQVYPQAVNGSITEVVPDIFSRADVLQGWIELHTDLHVGERVKIITENTSNIYRVIEVESDRFRVDSTEGSIADQSVFVYGRQVDDFRTVDYEAIAMLNVSATQEQQRLIEELQKENNALRNSIDELVSRLVNIESKVATGKYREEVATAQNQ